MLSPLFIRKVREEEGLEVYALSGTPVDCVKVAFDYLLRERKVDLVLSGINHGSNSAVALLYSGTMGAAIEGSFYDCPSIGLSLTDHRPDADFTAARIWGERIVRDVLEHPAPLPLCLNVNIPAGAPRRSEASASAGRRRGCGANSSSADRTRTGATTCGSRANSSTTSTEQRRPTNGRSSTVTSRYSPCRQTRRTTGA